jgi:hypothetical protein
MNVEWRPDHPETSSSATELNPRAMILVFDQLIKFRNEGIVEAHGPSETLRSQ